MFQCAHCYNLFFFFNLYIYQMYQVHSWYIYGSQGRGAWKIGLGKEVIINKWLKSHSHVHLWYILGFGFLLRILWGKYFWIHDTLKRKKIFLSVLTGYWGSGKNWSLSFKKALVSPSFLKYKDTSHFFFFNQDFRMTNKQV